MVDGLVLILSVPINDAVNRKKKETKALRMCRNATLSTINPGRTGPIMNPGHGTTVCYTLHYKSSGGREL